MIMNYDYKIEINNRNNAIALQLGPQLINSSCMQWLLVLQSDDCSNFCHISSLNSTRISKFLEELK